MKLQDLVGKHVIRTSAFIWPGSDKQDSSYMGGVKRCIPFIIAYKNGLAYYRTAGENVEGIMNACMDDNNWAEVDMSVFDVAEEEAA